MNKDQEPRWTPFIPLAIVAFAMAVAWGTTQAQLASQQKTLDERAPIFVRFERLDATLAPALQTIDARLVVIEARLIALDARIERVDQMLMGIRDRLPPSRTGAVEPR